jgi:hypothetical protein
VIIDGEAQFLPSNAPRYSVFVDHYRRHHRGYQRWAQHHRPHYQRRGHWRGHGHHGGGHEHHGGRGHHGGHDHHHR